MPPRMTLAVGNLDKVLKKLDTAHPVYAEPLRRALTDAGRLGRAYVETRAPRGTGRLSRAIDDRVDPRPVPRFLRIGYVPEGPPMPTRRGFRYPGALEGGPKYTYRSGPLKGRPTRGWLSGASKFLRRQVNALLRRAAQETEQQWAA